MKNLILLAFLFSIVTSDASAQAIAEPDRTILMNLYNATGGGSWTNNTNWGTNTYPWYGVTVNELGFVTDLLLYNNNLTGSLPGINGLLNLRYFNCAVNKLAGSLPSLEGLTKLEVFIVERNAFTGDIPPLDNLVSLKDFHCGYNKLTGWLPTMTNLTNLQNFSCSVNQLNGNIHSIMNLTSLQTFHGLYNKFIGALPPFENLTNLTSFSVAFNQFFGPIPSLSGLSKLQSFSVSDNQLSGSIPTLTDLSSLEFFDCMRNELTGAIPDLSSLTNLETLYCSENKLTGSIPSLAGLINLKVFDCGLNQLSGSIPSLAGLNKLVGFGCYQNQISAITNFDKPQLLTNFFIDQNLINFTSFDNLTDPSLISLLSGGTGGRTAPQTISLAINQTGNTLSTNGAEGATPSKYTYHWYKGTPGSGTLLTSINGANSVDFSTLAAAGATSSDEIYVSVTHNTFTTGDPGGNKYIVFTSNALNIPLPVTFDEVSATLTGNLLNVNFSTLTETNCSHYEVQVSKDGKEFTTIGTIASLGDNGNSDTRLSYSFSKNIAGGVVAGIGLLGLFFIGFSRRNKLIIGALILLFIMSLAACSKTSHEVTARDENSKIFVRIKQVDIDGKTDYSKTVQAVKAD